MNPNAISVYHITHVDNLSSMSGGGELVSDALCLSLGIPVKSIGMASIKNVRLSLPVDCHPDTMVGDYVPFNFCPRSVMLYVIYRANAPGLAYRGGQGPVVHLEFNLGEIIRWAESHGRRWVFSLVNARAAYAEFRDSTEQLSEINWDAVHSNNFSSGTSKEQKQAEFLVHERVPWSLVQRIGVATTTTHRQAIEAIRHSAHSPPIQMAPGWYF